MTRFRWRSGSKNAETRRWQVCHRWWYGLWHRHRIEPFYKITISLEQNEWSIAKDAEPFSRRCNARHRQTFYDLGNVHVFNNGSICIHGKELPRQVTFHQKDRGKSHFKADVRHIWKVDSGTIRWNFWSVSNQLGKFTMETISGQWWRSHQSLACKGLCILRFCVMSWKGESEPNIKYCLGRTVGLVQRIHHDTEFWKQLTENHYIAARRRRPKVHEQNGRPSAIPRTNYLHVDVQWHHMGNWRQWTGMYC